ncbi:unnamed protein product [Schistocephalus solidus]|uniref:Smr domain-containing protein n=1 Tax=Schistocephalus solidus TaxID=70667 RepID=A0A183SEE5_SCHSO|nr:unnamed protein product [Schistocephalus solidus]
MIKGKIRFGSKCSASLGPVESEIIPDIVGKLMASTRLIEEESAVSEELPEGPVNVSVFEQLCELFPNSDRAVLHEIAEATGGDLEWAAGLALEAGQSSAGPKLTLADRAEELYQATAHPSAEGEFREETTGGPEDQSPANSTPLLRMEGPNLSDQDSNIKLDTVLEDTEVSGDEEVMDDNEGEAEEGFSDGQDNVNQESVTDSNPPTLRITREFVRHAYQRYADAMDLLKIDLDLDSLPEEVFADWTPEPEIEKSILTSFFRQLGYFEMVTSSHKNNSRGTRAKFPARLVTSVDVLVDLELWLRRTRLTCVLIHPPNRAGLLQCKTLVSDVVKCRNQGVLLSVDPNLHSFEDVLLEEMAVHLSIEEQQKHFELPSNQKALSALSQQFPGIDREILMETLVRCGFDLDTSIACIVAGVLDKDSFFEASRTSVFEAKAAAAAVVPPTAPRLPSNSKDADSLDKDVDLSFQEILDEEEAISRSVADQSKNMQTLAIQLTLKRLVSQYPGFEKPYLINLFIKSGMDEEATRQRLAEDGRTAEPLPSFTPLIPTDSPPNTRPPASVTVGSLHQAKESLATLEKEIDGLRRSMKEIHAARLGAKAASAHPGVVAFYNEEEHALAASGRERADSRSSTRSGLAFLDLHGLTQHHAMIALRRRLALLESGCPATPTATTTTLTSCPNFWLPKRLTVVTGWGSHASSQSFGLNQPHSVIRTSVLNFLRSRSYDFTESPYIGCGSFDIKLMHRTPKQAKKAANVPS